MPLTQSMSLPFEAKEEKKAWTSKVIFSASKIMKEAVKSFSTNELMLFFGILISGIGELFGRNFSLGWYALVWILLGVNIFLKTFKEAKKSLD